MPQHYNEVHLIGNLTSEVEKRYTNNDVALAEFGLAVNNNYKDDDTMFIDVTCWRQEAENAEEYLNKGQSVFVEGQLNFDQWEDEDGYNSKHSINATNVIFLHDSNRGQNSNDEPDVDDVEEDDFAF